MEPGTEVGTDETTTTEPTPTEEGATTEAPVTDGTGTATDTTTTTQPDLVLSDGEPQVVIPIEIREHTPFVTESGNINVIHEITLGDLLVSTLIMALLVFTVIGRVVRR